MSELPPTKEELSVALATAEERLAATEERLAATEKRLAATEKRLAALEEGLAAEKKHHTTAIKEQHIAFDAERKTFKERISAAESNAAIKHLQTQRENTLRKFVSNSVAIDCTIPATIDDAANSYYLHRHTFSFQIISEDVRKLRKIFIILSRALSIRRFGRETGWRDGYSRGG